MTQPSGGGDITRLIREAGSGDRDAEAELLQVLYADLHRMARRHMRGERPEHTLQPTALVNEAFVRLMRGAESTWNDRLHFLASASTVMRRVLVDYARRRRAVKRGQQTIAVELADEAGLASPHSPDRVLAVDQALTALAAVSARQARIVELRFFAGLGNDEIAALFDVSPRTVKREWIAAKAWLYRHLAPNP
jgi:RNA polymerase sigma factor (TIGR02999 family)